MKKIRTLHEFFIEEVTWKDYVIRLTFPDDTVPLLNRFLQMPGYCRSTMSSCTAAGSRHLLVSLTCGGKTIHMEESAIPDVHRPIIGIHIEIIVANAPGDISPHPIPKFSLYS